MIVLHEGTRERVAGTIRPVEDDLNPQEVGFFQIPTLVGGTFPDHSGYDRGMAEQLTLLVLVVAVATGLVTATVSAVLVQSRRTAFFRFFLANILLFNLLVLTGLVFRYAELQQQGPEAPFGAVFMFGLLAAMAPLKLAWLYAVACMNLVLPGEDPPAWFNRCYLLLAAPVLVVWVVLLFIGADPESPARVRSVLIGMEAALIGGAAASSVYLIFRAGGSPAGSRRRSLRIFGGLHLAVFAVMVASLGYGWLRGGGQTSYNVLFNSVFLVVYNVLPLAWILRFQPLGRTTAAAVLDRYGITAREREIIELICAGKTNREIADRLYISEATVKDHNYNVFRKTGVRNRVELASLFREPRPAARGGVE
jgi:DNA-binding CsgD family transcriptional regulator